MKRLLEQIGLTCISVLAIVFYFGDDFAKALSVISIVVFVIFMIVKKFRKTICMPIIALTVFASCVLNIAYTNLVYEKIVNQYDNKSAVITGQLVDEPINNNGYYTYKFNAQKIDGEPCDFDFIAYHDSLINMEPFDLITCDVRLTENKNTSYVSKGYFLKADFGYTLGIYSVTRTMDKPLYYNAISVRRSIRQCINDNLSQTTASLCNALLIGDKNSLDAEIKEDFRRSGASHLVVVSGMHFSILASGLFLIFRKFVRVRPLMLVPTFAFIIFYMSITGFSPSVMRSGIMMLLYGLGLFVSRDSHSANSLGVAALVIVLVFGPYCVSDVGLLLSFACTYSIIILSPKLFAKCSKRIINYDTGSSIVKKICKKIALALVGAVCVNLSAFVASMPLAIIFFGAVSTVSIVTTLLLYIPIEIILILCVVLSALYFTGLLEFLIFIIAFAIEILADFIFAVVSAFASFDFSYVYVHNDYVYVWLVLTAVLFVLTYFCRKKERVAVFVMSSILVFVFGFLSATFINDSKVTLDIYNVADGSAVVYNTPDSKSVLSFDCAASQRGRVLDDLKKNVDGISFSSSVFDSTRSHNSLLSLSEEFAIDSVLLYDNKRDVCLSENVSNIYHLNTEYHIDLSDGSTIDYLVLEDAKAITYMKTNTKTVLLLPEFLDVSMIPQEYRTADIIIVNGVLKNHHLLLCDTLVISHDDTMSLFLMKSMYDISDRVLLTKNGDIKILLEV